MAVIVTADWHLNDNPRDSYRFGFQTWLREEAHKREVEAVFVLGDLTEQKDEHRAWLVNQVVRCIAALAEVCPVIVLRGNHDFIDPDFPFFGFVGELQNVYWVGRPVERSDWGIKTLLLPHTDNYKKEWSAFHMDRYDLILTHNTFAGSDYGQGPLAKGIPVEVFPADAWVISGDVHIPQMVGPVRYVGAPYLVDFGDSYQPRVLLVDKAVIKSIKVPGPQKVLVEIDDLKQLRKAVVDTGDIVKVRVKMSAADHAGWPEMQKAIKEWGTELGVTVNTIQPMVLREPGSGSAARTARAKRDDSSLLHEYVRQRAADESTERTGLRLLKQG